MTLRMMCAAALSLAFALLVQQGAALLLDVSLDAATDVEAESEGDLRRPHVRSKRRSKKHHRLHHHTKKHHRHHSHSLEEKTSRPHCVSWKDDDRQPNDPLYQYADFTSKKSANAFFDEKKDSSRIAAIQYAHGVEINTYGSLTDNADQDNMALVCGISLSAATPWSAKAECDSGEVVDTMSECQIAGPFLGASFAGVVASDDGTTPPGCHYVTTTDGTTSSYYNHATSVSVTGADASVMAICRASTTQTHHASLSEVDEPSPVVRRSRLTVDPQADPNSFDARENDAGTVDTRAARDEPEPAEANIQLPPSFLTKHRRTPPHQTRMEQETTDQPPPAVHPSRPPPPAVHRKAPEKKQAVQVQMSNDAKQAAQAVKVLQELQDMKMQLEMKQLEKKIRMQLAGTANVAPPANKPVSTSSAAELKVVTTTAAAVLKVQTTTAAVLKAETMTATAAPEALEEEPCGNSNEFCGDWATKGECDKNAAYMNVVCRAACKQCMGAA